MLYLLHKKKKINTTGKLNVLIMEYIYKAMLLIFSFSFTNIPQYRHHNGSKKNLGFHTIIQYLKLKEYN